MLEHSKDWAVMHLPEQFRPLFYEPTIQVIDGKKQVVMQRLSPDVEMRMRYGFHEIECIFVFFLFLLFEF